MTDEQFELRMEHLEINDFREISRELRNRDTAQREALALARAERDQVIALLKERDTAQAQLAEMRRIVAGFLFNYDDGVGEPWERRLLDYARRLVAAKEFNAQAEQQEAQGAQAGDEALRNIISDALQTYALAHTPPSDPDVETMLVDVMTPAGEETIALGEQELDALADRIAFRIGKARTALATQPAAVKLPDRKRYNGLGSTAENLTSAAWNQCLDAVEKLNAVRGAEQ